MRRSWTVPALLLAACAAPDTVVVAPAPEEPDRPYVVMVSFDGMRHDFLDRAPTPNFDRVAGTGVRAAALVPSYPSKTFPNHYTLATGLYPANHGIVDNAFYDPELDATYRLGDSTAVRDARWYRGEPIWVTAEKQGLKAASFFWVGSEAAIGGVRPSYFKYYDGGVPYADRVDTVLHWLGLPPEARPQLVMLYFSEPDGTAHRLGPDDPAVAATVTELDAVLGRLLDGIEASPIAGSVHILITSDHGMAPVPADHVVYLDDYVDLDGIRVIGNATQAFLYFEGREERLWSTHDALSERLQHARVFLREETPPGWRYGRGHRIGDLVVAADPGWIVGRREGRPWSGGGMHGWDPGIRDMHGIFLAAGPGIVSGVELPAFENIHVYPLVARLLGLEPPATIDGRLEVVDTVLATPARR